MTTEEARLPVGPLDPEAVRAVLAYAVVLGGLAFSGAAWLARGSAEAERLVSTLVGLIGLVLGYYFGSRGVDEAQRTARVEVERNRGAMLTVDALGELVAGYERRLAEALAAGERQSQLVAAVREDPAVARKLDETAERLGGGEP